MLPLALQAKTQLVVVSRCGEPLFMFAATDISGEVKAPFAYWDALMQDENALAFFKLMLADPELTYRNWRVEDATKTKCT